MVGQAELEQKGKLHMLLTCQLPACLTKIKAMFFICTGPSESKLNLVGRVSGYLSNFTGKGKANTIRNGSMMRGGAPPRATKWHAQTEANAMTACGLQPAGRGWDGNTRAVISTDYLILIS